MRVVAGLGIERSGHSGVRARFLLSLIGDSERERVGGGGTERDRKEGRQGVDEIRGGKGLEEKEGWWEEEAGR